MMKKLIHIVIGASYKDGMGYQENILPVKHKELGFDVVIIGESYTSKKIIYHNESGIKTVLLPMNDSILKQMPIIKYIIPQTKGLYDVLVDEQPDIIFIHGVNTPSNNDVIKYYNKHPEISIFADNHIDYYNVKWEKIKQRLIYSTIFHINSKRIAKTCKKVWGVTPWRVDFLKNVFKLSPDKVDLLVMGGDEKYIDWDNKDSIRHNIRQINNIPQNAFLIITGGRIDKTKNIHFLIDAVKTIPNVHLLIFGKAQPDMEGFISDISCDRIHNVGWISPNESYQYFLASDLAFFPGTHSVLWEQACASGVPCVFKDWGNAFSHVDVGGNCLFIKDPNKDSIEAQILEIVNNEDLYQHMLLTASTKARPYFSYIEIAKRAIHYNSI